MSAGDWKQPVVVVELEEDSGGWIANCIELDYMACGVTVDEAKANFASGLEMSILLHRDLRGPHWCKLCRGKWVMPRFEWRFVEGQTP